MIELMCLNCAAPAFAGAEAAEKVVAKLKSVPQRLKPQSKCSTYGTAEAVPLSKTAFFSTLSLGIRRGFFVC